MPTPIQDFTVSATLDESGCCIHCGRDSYGEEDLPCSDDCPMYWEELGIVNPEYGEAA